MKSNTPLVVITVLITIVLTSMVWLGGISLVAAGYFLCSQSTATTSFGNDFSAPPFAVKVEAPLYVSVGEVIDLEVQVSNPTDKELQIGSIDIYDSLLNGFSVVRVNPKPTRKEHAMGFLSSYFWKMLDPGESFTATFHLKATKEGVWTGDVDFCTPDLDYVSSSVTMRIRAKPDSEDNR